ncbi:hypothetical protein BS50DRAFT_494393, partial [Corynespora cassiicola Philippines]
DAAARRRQRLQGELDRHNRPCTEEEAAEPYKSASIQSVFRIRQYSSAQKLTGVRVYIHVGNRRRGKNTDDSVASTKKRKRDEAQDDSLSSSTGVSAVSNQCPGASSRIRKVMESFAQHAQERFAQGSPALEHLPMLLQYNVDAALRRNADVLGMSDLWLQYEAISPFNKPNTPSGVTVSPSITDWPTSLLPTPLQAMIEHHPWIDLFPLPRMRDNILRAIQEPGICDEDDLCYDVCQYGDPDEKCVLIVWGSPWDPRAWEASLDFLKKWGWLLFGCVEMIEATNYWRAKRGERPLTLREVSDAMTQSVPKSLRKSAL